jgi:hypothetical protein
MVTLIYHKQLDDAWTAAAAELRGRLVAALAAAGLMPAASGATAAAAGGDGAEAAAATEEGGAGQQGLAGPMLHVIGRSRKQKVCLDADYVTERLQVNGREIVYR